MAINEHLRILRVNLTSNEITTEIINEDFYRLYPGGRALAGYYLLKEMPKRIDPYDPRNILVIANGLMTGSPIPTANRFVVAGLSPLTNAIGSSEAGGYWGPELKRSGFEAIIIVGRAESPVLLWIDNGRAKIIDASHFWRLTTSDAQKAIQNQFNGLRVRILQTGIGGENLVRFAGITNELRHFNGRNGMGAIMGSKKLKAIVVHGSKPYSEYAYDPIGLRKLGRKLNLQAKENPLSLALRDRGTPGSTKAINDGGMLPTFNFQKSQFDEVDRITWEEYEKKLFVRRRTCFGCPVQCKREVKINGEASEYGGPEYETIAAFGSDCGISDLNIIAKANELCNATTLDTISTGATIAFAMECFDKGLINLDDTDGIELNFGNKECILPIIEQIANRKGFGNLLAEGSKRLAEKIGKGSIKFSQHVKGQELPMHEPRGKYNVGMGIALSEIGADHLVVAHDTTLENPQSLPFLSATSLGFQNAQPSRSFSNEKMVQYFILESWNSFENVVGYCYFGPGPRGFINPEDILDSINLSTGWDVTFEDLLEMGERTVNLFRIFNLREGFNSDDDILPDRFFEEVVGGPLEGESINKQDFLNARKDIYSIKGWDPETGIPTRTRLEKLCLGWAADILHI